MRSVFLWTENQHFSHPNKAVWILNCSQSLYRKRCFNSCCNKAERSSRLECEGGTLNHGSGSCVRAARCISGPVTEPRARKRAFLSSEPTEREGGHKAPNGLLIPAGSLANHYTSSSHVSTHPHIAAPRLPPPFYLCMWQFVGKESVCAESDAAWPLKSAELHHSLTRLFLQSVTHRQRKRAAVSSPFHQNSGKAFHLKRLRHSENIKPVLIHQRHQQTGLTGQPPSREWPPPTQTHR